MHKPRTEVHRHTDLGSPPNPGPWPGTRCFPPVGKQEEPPFSLQASTWSFSSPGPCLFGLTLDACYHPEVSASALARQPLCNLVSLCTGLSHDSISLRSKSKALAMALRSHGQYLGSGPTSQFSPLQPHRSISSLLLFLAHSTLPPASGALYLPFPLSQMLLPRLASHVFPFLLPLGLCSDVPNTQHKTALPCCVALSSPPAFSLHSTEHDTDYVYAFHPSGMSAPQ